MINKNSFIYIFLVPLFFVSLASTYGQHRGDNIDFQGLDLFNDQSAFATGMGGAVTSLTGDVSLMFYNPASISSINKIQASVSGSYKNFNWRENQNYRPNRYFVTLPFYLEGLYIPDPAEDGMYDHERLWTDDQLIDSTYVLNAPTLGLDPYSEEAADWKKSKSNFNFNNVNIAIPFNLFGKSFVASLGYNNSMTIEDFDRNDTYLDPHIGYKAYGDIGRVNGTDSLSVNWFQYTRSRTGRMDNIALAVGYNIIKEVKVGLGFNYSWGTSDDLLKMKQIGTFHLINQQRFRYWTSQAFSEKSGSSDYSSTKFDLGLIVNLNKFNLGIKIDLPYTLERNWKYDSIVSDTNGTVNSTKKGIDKLEYPAVFNFGASFNPAENFTVAIDYEFAPFSKAKFDLSDKSGYHSEWVDRHTIKIGASYSPFDFLTVLVGYRNIPQTFVPDGAAVDDSGPIANSYTGGLSFNTSFGRFDISYEYRKLKYYDSYYSNTNYNTIENQNILFGYTLNIL